MNTRDYEPADAEKSVANASHALKFDSRLILLVFIVICTAYVLAKLH